MEIQEHKQGAVTVLKPMGPLAQDDAEQFRQKLMAVRRASMGRVVFDATAVPFVDSRGLEVLVDMHAELSRSGQVLRVCGLNETVREVLDLTDVASLVEEYSGSGDAVRSFL